MLRSALRAALLAACVTASSVHAVTLSFTDFEGFATGASVNGQGGWGVTGPYDQQVENFGGNVVWRVSNAVTSGSFGDMPFAPRPGGIPTDTVNFPTNGNPQFFAGQSSTGALYNRFYAEFDVRSATGAAQPGARITISPDNGSGGRQGFVAIRDDGTAIAIDTFDVDSSGNFLGPLQIASGLSYGAFHKIGIELLFGNGTYDDVANYYVNGSLVHTDKGWEAWYAANQSALHPLGVPVQSLIFRVSGTAVPSVNGGGFYFDNVLTQATSVPEPFGIVLLGLALVAMGVVRQSRS